MDLGQNHAVNTFAVVGDTLNPEKYAYKIKEGLLEQGYTVHSVGKELQSLNEIPGDLDIIDLCINPAKGIQLLRECRKPFRCIVISPAPKARRSSVISRSRTCPISRAVCWWACGSIPGKSNNPRFRPGTEVP
ncbi:MAG: CoA-binding protein [Acutalibacteraceae bacterium]